MTRLMVLMTAVLVVATTGCNPKTKVQQSSPQDGWSGDRLQNTTINNAIIAQHTLFPYHFTPNGETLNELGLRDLAVLASHYRRYPGKLNIRRGNTDPAIYVARVRHALASLGDAGVDTNRIATYDGLPGGEGMTSEQVLIIRQRETEQASIPSRQKRQSSKRTGVRS